MRTGSLRRQLLAVLAAVALLAIVVLHDLAGRRIDDAAGEAGRRWAESVARVAAGIAAPLLNGNGSPAAVEALRELAAMPGVVRLDVVDHDGRAVLALEQTAPGRVQRVPAERLAAPARTGTDPLAVWVNAGSERPGSVGLRYALEDARLPLSTMRGELLAAIAAFGLLLLGATLVVVGRGLAPLGRLARFSQELVDGHGPKLVLRRANRGSREVVELADALNEASARLHAQQEHARRQDAARQSILNAVPDVLLALDENCCVRLANPGLTSVFGLTPEEAIGVPLERLLPGIDAEAVETRTSQGLYLRSTRTHVARFEIDARRHDGTAFPAEVSLSRTETDDGPRYAVLVRDVTEQRMANSMLNLYSLALECTTNGVVISDVSLPGSPVFYANPAFYRITGYEPGEVIGRNCSLLQAGDTAQPEIDVLRRAVAERRSAEVVLRNYRKDGTLFFNELAIAPVRDADGGLRHYVGVINDVTERERSRMAIAERSARLNAVFELSPDGFVVFDGDERLVYCNPAFLAMTGWEGDDEVPGLSMDEFERRLAAQCDPAQPVRPLAQALTESGDGVDSGAERAPDTLVLMRPERRVLARMARCQRKGHVESILFFRDVTRETEVDRMKSEFLTTAAHELRTPMVSVFGFTELLLKRQVPEPRRKEMLETIHRQASLLIHMVNELLDLARIEARQGKDIQLSICRVAELVAAAVEPMVMGPRGADLAVDLADGDAAIEVDAEKTRQALTNVLSNAVKYSPRGGPIVVSTRRGTLRGQPAVGVRITDRGIGMTPEQVARVFERFYRADPSGNIPGTGLGMSLVKEIVELQGGRVEVASEAGAGTSVTLWWPLGNAALPAPLAAGAEMAMVDGDNAGFAELRTPAVDPSAPRGR